MGILSTFPTSVTASMSQLGLPANYASISGTSMAAPHITGLAALLWSHQPGLTAAEVKSRIVSRGDALTPLLGKTLSGRRANALGTVGTSGPPPAALQFSSVSATFSGGNGDGALNPGETIELTPEMLNLGGQNATAVTVEVAPQTSGLTVIGNASLPLTNVAPMERARPATALKITVPSGVANNTRVSVVLTARWSSGQQVTQTWSTVVLRSQPKGEVELAWAPGEPVADPARELVYLLDKTNLRVLAVDTASGTVAAWAGLAGSSEIAPPVENGSLRSGMLAVSADGNTLWVALTAAKKVQSFNLPALTPAATLDVSFSPVSLAQSASGRLFVTSTDYWGPIRELNPATGAVLRTFDKGGANGTFYMHTLLRLSANGQRLLAGETGLWVVGGPGYCYEYDVSGAGTPSLAAKHPFWEVYLKDFAVDSTRQRIYTVNGGIYAVQVTETSPGGAFGEQWPFASAYGSSVALPSGSDVVHGASADPYNGEITRFDASSGNVLERCVVGTDGRYLPARAVTVTPGGAQAYIKAQFTGSSSTGVNGTRYFFGIVGLPSVDLGSLPAPTPAPPNLLLANVEFSDPDANSDGNAAPGETIRLLPRFRNAGGLPATGVAVACSTSLAGVTVQAPATLAISDVPAYGNGAPGSAFRLAIDPSVADGTSVDVTFTTTYGGNQTVTSKWRFTVRTIIPNTQTATASGALGSILADRTRNLVYLLDRQNHRVLALDTSLGAAVASCPLEGPVKIGTAPPALGGMALSPDGGTLYIAVKQAKIIQSVALPQFKTTAAWTYAFEPNTLVTDAQGRLYASGTGVPLQQINPATGAVNGTFGTTSNTMLRSSSDGTLLFSNLLYTSQVQRYDTSSGGLPVLIGNTTVSSVGSTIYDYAWDNTRQVFFAGPYGSNLKRTSLTGTVEDWPATYGVTTVEMSADDTQVWSATRNGASGLVRVFNAVTGATVRDFSISGGGNYGLVDGSLAVTPNGRAVYVLQNWVGAYNSSADGYTYKVGIIGSSLADLDLPLAGGLAFSLKSTTLTDPLPSPNNNDTFVNPGETVRLLPVIKNQSMAAVSGVQIQLISASANATVLTTTPVNVGEMAAYASYTPASPFQLLINSGASDGEELLVKFRVSRSGASDEDLEYRITVSKPATVVTATLAYQVGEIMADPSRNLVYLVDKTNARLFAFSTETNSITAATPLAGGTGQGFMDISPDQSKLYIALTGARKIQVFNLPDLTQADIVDVNFDIHSIMLGADGFIYASSTDNSGNLRKVDTLSGTVVASFNDGGSIYSRSVLRGTGDRKRLLMVETGLSGVSSAPEWDITGPSPVIVDSHSFNLSNTKDIRVDDKYRRLYFASGGVYGIGVTEMDTGLAGILWPHGGASWPHGAGVAFLPDDRFVYGLSAGSITRFSRVTGARLARYDVASASGDLGDRCLAITPNGGMLFVRKPTSGNHILGVVGGPAISTTLPAIAPANYAGPNATLREDNSTTFAASILNNGTAGALSNGWRIVSGPGTTVFSDSSALQTDASFSKPGRYLLEMTTTSGSLAAADILVVDVAAAPPQVFVSASKEVGSLYGRTGAELTFTRSRGDLAQALVVDFTIGGTATPGVHYSSLGTSVTIPAGVGSLTIPVTPLPGAVTTPLTVTVTINANAAYELGSSAGATLKLMDGSYASWKTLKSSEGAVNLDFANWRSLRAPEPPFCDIVTKRSALQNRRI